MAGIVTDLDKQIVRWVVHFWKEYDKIKKTAKKLAMTTVNIKYHLQKPAVKSYLNDILQSKGLIDEPTKEELEAPVLPQAKERADARAQTQTELNAQREIDRKQKQYERTKELLTFAGIYGEIVNLHEQAKASQDPKLIRESLQLLMTAKAKFGADIEKNIERVMIATDEELMTMYLEVAGELLGNNHAKEMLLSVIAGRHD